MADEMQLNINDKIFTLDLDGDRMLLGVLRDDLGLTGSKYGCGEAQCGACTVLIDGRMARSCVTRAANLEGKRIVTIEGMQQNGRLHPLQQAFIEADAMQCGYCTAGMIMSAADLLSQNADPSTEEIARFMNGNVCRCGTYPRIIDAVQSAARAMKGGAK